MRRRNNPHPGVVVMKPEAAGRISWRVRYRDPETGKLVKESVPAEFNTPRGAHLWAKVKSAELGHASPNRLISLVAVVKHAATRARRANVERELFLRICLEAFDEQPLTLGRTG